MTVINTYATTDAKACGQIKVGTAFLGVGNHDQENGAFLAIKRDTWGVNEFDEGFNPTVHLDEAQIGEVIDALGRLRDDIVARRVRAERAKASTVTSVVGSVTATNSALDVRYEVVQMGDETYRVRGVYGGVAASFWLPHRGLIETTFKSAAEAFGVALEWADHVA